MIDFEKSNSDRGMREGVFYLFVFLLQVGLAFILLSFSTLISWYEGSAILDNPSEWPYSTPFSQIFYGVVESEKHLSMLDYFVYAAKFQPVFPVLMAISGLYLFVLIGYHFFKKQLKWFAYYLLTLASGLLLLSYFISSSPTAGGQILFYNWFISGIICVIIAAMLYFIPSKRTPKDAIRVY